MDLQELLKNSDTNKYVLEVSGKLENINVKCIRNDSRLVEKDSIFIAVKGVNNDGTKYVDQAKENGAVAIVFEENIDLKDYEYLDMTLIRVKEIRKFVAYMSRDLYKNPTKRVPVIAITGSKGKTTSTFVLQEILMKQGYNVGIIGTVGAYHNKEKIMDLENTTGESFQTNEIMNNMISNGVNIIILEVSSQSVVADRVEGMSFEYSCFTNFSEDHISKTEHPNMEAYYNAKIEIIEKAPVIILNMDDKEVQKVKDILKNKKIITYGKDTNNDIIIDSDNITYLERGTQFVLKYNNNKENFETNMLGEIAVYNVSCAIAIANELNVDLNSIKEGIKNIYVEGRFNFIENDLGINIIIDYAHTEESLHQCLLTLRNITTGNLISLWGLSGQRDKGKRPKMGKISGKLADLTIITSEDPRNEDPEDIAKEIAVGVEEVNGKYFIENDRKLAIFKAIDIAKPGDTVALLGKGQERSQIFKDKEIYLNEKEIVEEYLTNNKKN